MGGSGGTNYAPPGGSQYSSESVLSSGGSASSNKWGTSTQYKPMGNYEESKPKTAAVVVVE